MTNFKEYKVMDRNDANDVSEITKFLNMEAKDRWQLVHSYNVPDDQGHKQFFVFGR